MGRWIAWCNLSGKLFFRRSWGNKKRSIPASPALRTVKSLAVRGYEKWTKHCETMIYLGWSGWVFYLWVDVSGMHALKTWRLYAFAAFALSSFRCHHDLSLWWWYYCDYSEGGSFVRSSCDIMIIKSVLIGIYGHTSSSAGIQNCAWSAWPVADVLEGQAQVANMTDHNFWGSFILDWYGPAILPQWEPPVSMTLT